MDQEVIDEHKRVPINLRVDPAKFAVLERLRVTGFGLAQTERNRSDVYNEILGYGIQTNDLRQRIGERDFEKLWRVIQRVNWQKINLEQVEKLIVK